MFALYITLPWWQVIKIWDNVEYTTENQICKSVRYLKKNGTKSIKYGRKDKWHICQLAPNTHSFACIWMEEMNTKSSVATRSLIVVNWLWVKTNSGIREIPNVLRWPRHCKNAKNLDLGYFQTTSNLNLHESKHKTSAAFVQKLQSDSRTEKEWSARFLSGEIFCGFLILYSSVLPQWPPDQRPRP